jgi:hypothetical protein
MPVELGTFLYEAAGPFVSVAPTVQVSSTISNACTTPKDGLAIELYDELKLGAKIEILDHKLAEWSWSKNTPSVLIYPTGKDAAVTCPAANECTTDTSCGLSKACSWDGAKKCCRTPAPLSAKKCLADAECPTGTVCGWNLDAFVCQTPACN